MKNVNSEFNNLNRIVKMISEQFGSKCEVILHDLTKDYNHTIISIENGHITNREVGGSGSNLGLQVLSGKKKDGDEFSYITQTKDGKLLRSSTVFLRDEKDKVIGALCVNYDISDLMMAKNIIDDAMMFNNVKSKDEPEFFANNVGEIIDHLIQQCQNYIGKPGSLMTKEEKIRALKFFDDRGAFLITKSGDQIREYLGISKYTLYNYLDIARKVDDEEH
ncbi:helix-turn-helix transcriptional regulator [Miniphocaeibacter massiliensis]|uniref:helix-turn-helix transcriptional regulator n=1 Tax=Miniphocaeibacter massiliensis TaxID=2041841 RepID=UPI000C1C1DB9|nr:helix-turn-helix transcriptional regulator [Miniphocaeibacter massiliensis]